MWRIRTLGFNAVRLPFAFSDLRKPASRCLNLVLPVFACACLRLSAGGFRGVFGKPHRPVDSIQPRIESFQATYNYTRLCGVPDPDTLKLQGVVPPAIPGCGPGLGWSRAAAGAGGAWDCRASARQPSSHQLNSQPTPGAVQGGRGPDLAGRRPARGARAGRRGQGALQRRHAPRPGHAPLLVGGERIDPAGTWGWEGRDGGGRRAAGRVHAPPGGPGT